MVRPIQRFMILAILQNGEIALDEDEYVACHRSTDDQNNIEALSAELNAECIRDGRDPDDFLIVVFEAHSQYVSSPSLLPFSY